MLGRDRLLFTSQARINLTLTNLYHTGIVCCLATLCTSSTRDIVMHVRRLVPDGFPRSLA